MPEYADALTPYTDDPFERAAQRTRSSVAPAGGRQEGAATKVLAGYVPHAIGNMASLPQRAVQAAGRYAEGGEYDPGPAIEAAFMMAGNVPFAKPGAAGIFGGRLAKTADHAKLARAQEMDAAGASPNHIWHNTGWFKGKDGAWRFEIPDEGAAVRPPTALSSKGKLETFMSHPALYEAYPDARNMRVEFETLPAGILGRAQPSITTDPFGGKITLDHNQISMQVPRGGSGADTRNVLLHEVQHPVQRLEGFTPGGSPTGVMRMLQSRLDDVRSKLAAGEVLTPDEIARANTISEMLTNPDKFRGVFQSSYERLLGEVEARNVEARSRFSAHARQYNPPWMTWDTPTDRQVVPGINRKKAD